MRALHLHRSVYPVLHDGESVVVTDDGGGGSGGGDGIGSVDCQR